MNLSMVKLLEVLFWVRLCFWTIKITIYFLVLGDKFLVSREKIKESDKKGVSQPDGAVLMGAEKLAFVQKYLDDVQETRSTTTETSDSALGIHAATSEFETEEVRGKHS